VAAARSNTSLCELANSSLDCRKNYRTFHSFYREIIVSKAVTPALIAANANDMAKDELDDYVKAITTRDISLCKNAKSAEDQILCRAVASRSSGACGSKECSNIVNYIKAVEGNKEQACENIADENIRMLCRGDVTRDQNKCKQCEGFKKFIKEYYKNLQLKKGESR
jgi:hypothetical protein